MTVFSQIGRISGSGPYVPTRRRFDVMHGLDLGIFRGTGAAMDAQTQPGHDDAS